MSHDLINNNMKNCVDLNDSSGPIWVSATVTSQTCKDRGMMPRDLSVEQGNS